jgi:hypothetical protein
MPLYRDGEPITSPNLDGEIAPAKDHNGKSVRVSVSTEAIQDFGWETAWEVASRKYDQNGGDSVRVTTSDCKTV